MSINMTVLRQFAKLESDQISFKNDQIVSEKGSNKTKLQVLKFLEEHIHQLDLESQKIALLAARRIKKEIIFSPAHKKITQAAKTLKGQSDKQVAERLYNKIKAEVGSLTYDDKKKPFKELNKFLSKIVDAFLILFKFKTSTDRRYAKKYEGIKSELKSFKKELLALRVQNPHLPIPMSYLSHLDNIQARLLEHKELLYRDIKKGVDLPFTRDNLLGHAQALKTVYEDAGRFDPRTKEVFGKIHFSDPKQATKFYKWVNNIPRYLKVLEELDRRLKAN